MSGQPDLPSSGEPAAFRQITWSWPDSSSPQMWFPGVLKSALGYDQGELEPTVNALTGLLHPDDLVSLIPRLRGVMQEKRTGEFEYDFRLRRKDGSYVPVRGICSVTLRPDTGSLCMFGVAHIQEQPEESPLGLSTDALHIVLNEMGHPVVLMTTEGLILQANDATARLLGGERGGVVLRYCPFLHEQDGTVLAPQFMGNVIGDGRRQDLELQRFGRWWHIHLVPLRDSQDRVVRLLLIAHDITTIKARQQVELADQRNLTSVLLREIHHRIKNHLQGVIGLLRSHARSTQSLDHIIDAAATQIRSIAAVHGLLSERAESVMFEELVGEIAHSLRDTSPIPISLPPFHGSLVLSQDEAIPLAVSVAELLTNAMKHTPPDPAARVIVTIHSDDSLVELRIRNGPARLPDGFQLPSPDAPASGLVLIRTLLPHDLAQLDIHQEGADVMTVLRVVKPVSRNVVPPAVATQAGH